jgi:ATP-binding cassette subfamily B protein
MTYRELFLFIAGFIKLQRWKFLGILIVSFVWSLDATLWPLILKKAVDIFNFYDNDRPAAWNALIPVMIGGAFLWMATEAGFRIQGFLVAKAHAKLEADIRLAMFDHIQYHSPK